VSAWCNCAGEVSCRGGLALGRKGDDETDEEEEEGDPAARAAAAARARAVAAAKCCSVLAFSCSILLRSSLSLRSASCLRFPSRAPRPESYIAARSLNPTRLSVPSNSCLLRSKAAWCAACSRRCSEAMRDRNAILLDRRSVLRRTLRFDRTAWCKRAPTACKCASECATGHRHNRARPCAAQKMRRAPRKWCRCAELLASSSSVNTGAGGGGG
jgi:hypothetical protein